MKKYMNYLKLAAMTEKIDGHTYVPPIQPVAVNTCAEKSIIVNQNTFKSVSEMSYFFQLSQEYTVKT